MKFLLLLFCWCCVSEICEINLDLEKFHVLNLGNELQSYSIDFNADEKINVYYRVYNLIGDCYVKGEGICDNADLNIQADAFMIHNDFFQIKNGTLEFYTLCNLTFPNMICETKKIGDKDIYTNRILILENSSKNDINVAISIKITEYNIKVPSCEDYVSESSPFPWLQNSTFIMVGFCFALACCIICCVIRFCSRACKFIAKRC